MTFWYYYEHMKVMQRVATAPIFAYKLELYTWVISELVTPLM